MIHIFNGKCDSSEKTVSFKKHLEVLNYVPIDFRFTRRWVLFSDLSRFISRIEKRLEDTNADEFNSNMFDSEIAAEEQLMKESAAHQKTLHTTIVEHNADILRGEIEGLNSLKGFLKTDLDELDKMITEFESIKGD